MTRYDLWSRAVAVWVLWGLGVAFGISVVTAVVPLAVFLSDLVRFRDGAQVVPLPARPEAP